MDPISFLQAIQGFQEDQATGSADQPIRLAVIDPAYVGLPTLPKVRFEGEGSVGIKTYPVVNGYSPRASDRVVMVPVGRTYLILGRTSNPGSQGFWTTGTVHGVALGGGSYFATDDGLVINDDITLTGDLLAGGSSPMGRGLVGYAQSAGNSANVTVTTATNVLSTSVTLKAGRAYRIHITSGVRRVGASTSTLVQLFMMWNATVPGRMFNVSTPTADVAFTVDADVYFRRTAGTDTTGTLAFGIGSLTAGQAVRRDGDVQRPSVLTIHDIGPSGYHPYAIDIP